MFDEYSSSVSSASSRLITTLHSHSSPLSSPHSHSQLYGQRASKASDIAHLLDPSYSPTRATYDNRIYVDHAGEAHDPDFRLFAPVNYSPRRREFLTCDSDDDDDDDDDEDVDVEDEGVSLYSPRRGSFESYRPSSRASDPLYSHARTHAAYAPFAYTYTYDDAGYLSEEEPRRESKKLRRRRASNEEPARPAPVPVEEPHMTSTPSPTCSHAFRRQWHALRLRTQVAAFRARKRVSRIVSPSTG